MRFNEQLREEKCFFSFCFCFFLLRCVLGPFFFFFFLNDLLIEWTIALICMCKRKNPFTYSYTNTVGKKPTMSWTFKYSRNSGILKISFGYFVCVCVCRSHLLHLAYRLPLPSYSLSRVFISFFSNSFQHHYYLVLKSIG